MMLRSTASERSAPRPGLLSRLRRNRRGNVIMIFAFAAGPLICATGMAVDYTNAMRIQSRLNAAADAAVLAATSQQLMSSSVDVAKQRALDVFKITAGTINGLTLNPDDANAVTIKVVDTNGASNVRNATLTFRGTSHNSFGGILGIAQLTVKGVAAATAKVAPDIDFYVLLDTSGSMALPSTSAGITLLKQKANGCAFACHSTNDATAQRRDGTWGDYYSVAVSYGIPLRMDDAKKAVADMMSQATTLSRDNNADYRAALATFAASDARAPNAFKVQQSLTSNLSQVSTAARNVPTSLYYRNGCPTSNFCNNDVDSATSDAFQRMNGIIPNPGSGTKIASDTPQAIMFIVTDGMRDEFRPGGKPEVKFDNNWCTTIKSRNIGIAILYTEYMKESVNNDAWSVDPNSGDIVNRLPQIEPALQACVSRSEYYTKVSSDGDISAALNKLFRTVVKTAYITR